MGNYYRPIDDPDYIQADIAFRLGSILRNYNNSIVNHTKAFEVTLSIAVLQTVLTQCTELIKTLKNQTQKAEHKYLLSAVDQSNYFGLNTEQIEKNTFKDPLTADNIFRHLRNSLSHPTGTSLTSQYPNTGYTTKQVLEGNLYTFTFISSPDTKGGRPKLFQTKNEAKIYVDREKSNSPFSDLIYISINGGFSIRNCRIFSLTLTVDEIKELALKLCTYLAQPIMDQWVEKSYNEHILVA